MIMNNEVLERFSWENLNRIQNLLARMVQKSSGDFMHDSLNFRRRWDLLEREWRIVYERVSKTKNI